MGTETAYDYQFEFESREGETCLFELGVHWETSVGGPRIEWRTSDGSHAGERGSFEYPEEHSRSSYTPMMTIEVVEPTLVFGRFEDERLTLPNGVYEPITPPERIGGVSVTNSRRPERSAEANRSRMIHRRSRRRSRTPGSRTNQRSGSGSAGAVRTASCGTG